MKLLVMLLLGVVATQISADHKTVLCGKELARAHAMYCYGMQDFPEEIAVTPVPAFPEYVEDTPEIPQRFMYRARRSAEARAFNASLVDACCLKPCLLSELLSHC